MCRLLLGLEGPPRLAVVSVRGQCKAAQQAQRAEGALEGCPQAHGPDPAGASSDSVLSGCGGSAAAAPGTIGIIRTIDRGSRAGVDITRSGASVGVGITSSQDFQL